MWTGEPELLPVGLCCNKSKRAHPRRGLVLALKHRNFCIYLVASVLAPEVIPVAVLCSAVSPLQVQCPVGESLLE